MEALNLIIWGPFIGNTSGFKSFLFYFNVVFSL